MIDISPSLFSADSANLSRDIAAAESAGTKYLHIDIMDGVFVPHFSFGPHVVKDIRPHSKMIFDVHLMIIKPWRYVERFIKAGADIITVHFEALEGKTEVIDTIREQGISSALCIKPATTLKQIEHLIPRLDFMLVMSIEPGYEGQDFFPESIPKIVEARKLIDKHNPGCKLIVDGGVDFSNIAQVAGAGADIIVAGRSIFKAPDIAQAVRGLRQKAIEGLGLKNK